ncbi:hypothetical protein Btru_005868 [Bulinus truncatus]|nr:hypothetical protein Btru_005868 [Bulinus truncatus]
MALVTYKSQQTLLTSLWSCNEADMGSDLLCQGARVVTCPRISGGKQINSINGAPQITQAQEYLAADRSTPSTGPIRSHRRKDIWRQTDQLHQRGPSDHTGPRISGGRSTPSTGRLRSHRPKMLLSFRGEPHRALVITCLWGPVPPVIRDCQYPTNVYRLSRVKPAATAMVQSANSGNRFRAHPIPNK